MTAMTASTALMLVGTLASTSAASATPVSTRHRPAAEHVPSTVHQVTINHAQAATPGKTVRLTRAQATRLVQDFDRLRREPRGTIHCELAGGPTDTVRFTAKHHVWVARQAACTNVRVTRDGTALPTLLPTAAWDKALRHDRKVDA